MKKINRTKCEDCGLEIANSSIVKHKGSKLCLKTQKNPTKFEAKFTILENGDCKCDECGFVTNKIGIKGHYWRLHTEEGKEFGSGTKGKPTWSKGLTKATNISIARQAEKQTGKRKSGRKHTQETKDKISASKKAYFDKNPDKVLYKIFNKGESYPEKVFRECLEKNNIKGWAQEFQFHRYNFDFAFPEYKLDVEIDGKTHLDEKVKEKDRIRDERAKSEGWKVVRFKVDEIRDNVYACVNKVLNELGEKQIEIPKEFLHAKMLAHLREKEKENKRDIKSNFLLVEKQQLSFLFSQTDLKKKNWTSKIGKALKRTPKYVKVITEKYYPEIYKDCFKSQPIGLRENNSQFGTCWVTKEGESKKIKKEELDHYSIQGWVKGRKAV